MKTIGLLGGMSWESTQLYYRVINETVKARLGGLHSAKLAMVSVDFHEVELLQHAGDWDQAGQLLAQAARNVEKAGADVLLVCTNTMHKVAPQIEAALDIPLLHIADATADEILASGMARIGLLGTAFTMEQSFYKERLERRGINVVVPGEADRKCVHRVIYEELCLGTINDASRDEYLVVVDQLAKQGAEAIILGCTEITLLIGPEHTSVPLFDTTQIHAEKAVEFALT